MENISVEKTLGGEYKKEDFNTEAPYRELFALWNNRFKFNQRLTELTENAEKVGFKGFARMLKAYAQTQSEKGIVIDNSTQFTGQEIELKAGEWVADDFGVTRRNERNGEDIACVHPIMPVERLINIDTGVEKLKIAFKKGDIWRSEIYDRNTLASATNILDLANNGVAVTSENSRHLVRYIHDIENLNYDRIPIRKSVGRLGWTNSDGFSPYVEGLIFDGANNFKAMYEAVSTEGSLEEWLKIAKDVRRSDSPSKIMLLPALPVRS